MFSQSMSHKQILSSFKKSPNLCEVSTEYPALQESLAPRHLCTSIKREPSPTIRVDKLSHNRVNQKHEQHIKEAKTSSKHIEEQTEIIKLFQFKQEEAVNDKLYKKRRSHLTKTINNDENNNTDSTE